ncbi:MAG: hypothetical protein K0B08_09510 [Bacteroidales bacterium]|nr:hypothetical protein [Bacteroidales bacterium]
MNWWALYYFVLNFRINLVKMLLIMVNKFIFFLTVIMICFSFQTSAQKMTDLERLGVKGKVHSILETKYTILEESADMVRDKAILSRLTIFNPDGYESEVTTYENGKIASTSHYFFDGEGKQAEMKEYKPDGTLRHTVTYNYDDKGFRTEAVYHWVEQRFYDNNRERTEHVFEIFERNMYSRVVFLNDYRSLPLEENYFRDDGNLSYRYINKYDVFGNKTVMTYINPGGRTSWITKYKYDRNQNLLEGRVFKSNRTAVSSKFTSQYDLNGNWISRYEKREVVDNILTTQIERGDYLTEREIEYY